MKEVANSGKSSNTDFLILGNNGEFLRETLEFLSIKPHIVTNHYKPKVIHQFLKAVYLRAKENQRARKGGAQIISIFIEKIYRERADMKHILNQALQWEQDIKALLE